ncbi:ubiquitin-like protein atg12 [Anaeramoeba ignava]|uniref:Ubiquitin-like protein ATG12 n=1 Tax=Anaeramoeba ignava TaxID=1746090 RepID=A0A9Q0LBP3_ANAIG|nr:ubiquitin-like protein atg12 [Anaeramoeba ignava]
MSTQKQRKKKVQDPNNVIVKFIPTAGVPLTKITKFQIKKEWTIGQLSTWWRSKLKLDENQSLLFYIQQSFSPSLDETVENLYNCFQAGNILSISYALSVTWG